MKRIINIVLCGLVIVCCTTKANAQVQMSYAMDEPTFMITHKDVSKFQQLDSSRVAITYRYNFRESAADDSLKAEDYMTLLVGRNYVSFFSKNLRELDEKNTESIKTTMSFDTPEPSWQGYDILRSVAQGTITVSNRVPFTDDVCQYTEPVPTIEWTYIPEDTATVMGFHCHAATCEYGGRKWKAYYACNILLPYGPWKFGGLKGTILKVFDTEHNFIFEAEGLTQKPLPIVRYDWKYKQMTKEEWLKFEANMYKNAGAFVKNSGARVIIMDDSDRGFHPLNESWEQFYNPIEK